MKTRDSVKLAFVSITQRGVRSWLTIVGVVIGIAALISLVGIGQGVTQSITSQLDDLGADLLTITPGVRRAQAVHGPGALRSSSDVTAATLDERDTMAIKRVPGVDEVGASVSGRLDVKYLNEEASLTVTGVDPRPWKEMTTYEIEEGRFLNPSDPNSVIIGSSVATSVFARELVLNSQIEIEGKMFKVVGILKESGGFSSNGNSIIITLDSADSLLESDGEYNKIEVKVVDADAIEEITEKIEAQLMLSRGVTESSKDFTVFSSASLSDRVAEMTATMTMFMAAIASISLLVGALGIANTMYMSVMERTRQIGVMKSLGSTDAEILRLFVIESAFLGTVGGIIGIFVGFLISWFISSVGVRMLMGQMTSVISPGMVVFALIFSMVVGTLSGVLPAKKAAAMDPVDALRYE